MGILFLTNFLTFNFTVSQNEIFISFKTPPSSVSCPHLTVIIRVQASLSFTLTMWSAFLLGSQPPNTFASFSQCYLLRHSPPTCQFKTRHGRLPQDNSAASSSFHSCSSAHSLHRDFPLHSFCLLPFCHQACFAWYCSCLCSNPFLPRPQALWRQRESFWDTAAASSVMVTTCGYSGFGWTSQGWLFLGTVPWLMGS